MPTLDLQPVDTPLIVYRGSSAPIKFTIGSPAVDITSDDVGFHVTDGHGGPEIFPRIINGPGAEGGGQAHSTPASGETIIRLTDVMLAEPAGGLALPEDKDVIWTYEVRRYVGGKAAPTDVIVYFTGTLTLKPAVGGG